jgi:hypothetical protein
MSFILISTNLIAIGLAPVVTGVISDHLGATGEALRSAIIIMISMNIFGIIAYTGSAWQLSHKRTI